MASAPLDNGPYQISRFCADSNGVIKGRAFKLEAINELENEIFNARGIRISIPHVNQTEHNAYQDYYDEKSRKQVEFLFREDIDMFGYEFDGKSNYPNGY